MFSKRIESDKDMINGECGSIFQQVHQVMVYLCQLFALSQSSQELGYDACFLTSLIQQIHYIYQIHALFRYHGDQTLVILYISASSMFDVR